MEPTTPIPQSQAGGIGHRLPFFFSSTMILCLCVTAFGMPTGVTGASTPPQIPLFAETTNVAPPPIAQAKPEPQVHKR
jgi:hypothetical protein